MTPTAGLPAPGPYEKTFGSGRRWMFRAGISRALFTYPGALEVGFKAGFFRATGKEFQLDTNGNTTTTRSADSTSLNIIPTSVTVTYRFDVLAEHYHIPLAPYARLALERYNWWISKGGGGSAKVGATNGWSWSGGVALQLDFFDPGLSRELDHETGINRTYAFFDVTKTYVDDFGSSKSWDLSDKKYSLGFGLMFVF